MLRFILKPFAIWHVRYLQARYKSISLENRYNQTNQVLATLELLQAKLAYYKSQFHAWGYYHPSCVWSPRDEKFFRKLFPEIDFEELETVVWNNPAAVTFYRNLIYQQRGSSPSSKEIIDQLKKWEDHN
jgi:hypothetical protein